VASCGLELTNIPAICVYAAACFRFKPAVSSSVMIIFSTGAFKTLNKLSKKEEIFLIIAANLQCLSKVSSHPS